MSRDNLNAGPAWQELDAEAMAGLDGGGPFAEFVYDATHTVITVVKFLYDARPQYGPGQAGYASAKAS